MRVVGEHYSSIGFATARLQLRPQVSFNRQNPAVIGPSCTELKPPRRLHERQRKRKSQSLGDAFGSHVALTGRFVMGLIALTSNVTDHSNDNGFQFEFHCDKCGNGYMTSFQPSKVGMAGGFLARHPVCSAAPDAGPDRRGGRLPARFNPQPGAIRRLRGPSKRRGPTSSNALDAANGSALSNAGMPSAGFVNLRAPIWTRKLPPLRHKPPSSKSGPRQKRPTKPAEWTWRTPSGRRYVLTAARLHKVQSSAPNAASPSAPKPNAPMQRQDRSRRQVLPGMWGKGVRGEDASAKCRPECKMRVQSAKYCVENAEYLI